MIREYAQMPVAVPWLCRRTGRPVGGSLVLIKFGGESV
jgi:hypothetical protein